MVRAKDDRAQITKERAMKKSKPVRMNAPPYGVITRIELTQTTRHAIRTLWCVGTGCDAKLEGGTR